jgi:DNA polymerase-3 subunit epsilon
MQTQMVAYLKNEQKQGLLPAAISREHIQELPDAPGIYFFYGEKNQLLYVGKSKSIRKRVTQHFAADMTSQKHLDFKLSIRRIAFELAGNDLVAQLMECDAIKRLRPPYNAALRRTQFQIGIFQITDEQGYHTLAIHKLKDMPHVHPLIALASGAHAKNLLTKRAKEYRLCQKLCDLYKSKGPCFHLQVGECDGACIGKEAPESYNRRVASALSDLQFKQNSFFVVGAGRNAHERSVVEVKNGHYVGYGFFTPGHHLFAAAWLTAAEVARHVKPMPTNKDTDSIIRAYLRTRHSDLILANASPQKQEAVAA